MAEESRWVTDDGTGWEPRARVGNRLDRSERVGCPEGCEREKPESEHARERFRRQEGKEGAHALNENDSHLHVKFVIFLFLKTLQPGAER